MADSSLAPSPAPSPFDALAASYDRTFSESVIGRTLRRRVWRVIDAAFGAGARVLDVGCGTGEDALHLAERGVHVVATDASEAMVAETRRKAERAGLSHRIDAVIAPAEALAARLTERGTAAPFDGALSNFGALNCVGDLAGAGAQIARLLHPGARAFLCLMGPVVPWEWAWYIGQGKPAKAFRRLRPGGTKWRGVHVRYPTIGALGAALVPAFRPLRARALGALVPPSYAEPWARRHPGAFARLAEVEARLESVPPLPWLADHYLVELVRT